MTQTNNEREAFEKWYQSQFTGKVDFKRYSVNSIYYDNDDIETSWEAWEARAQSPISQNEEPKQIPDGWKLIGKVSEMGVIWHKQNPHAHPCGTEFYAVLPTTSLTSETNTEVGE